MMNTFKKLVLFAWVWPALANAQVYNQFSPGGDLAGTGSTWNNQVITSNAVTNAKAAQMPATSLKCNSTSSTANAADCDPLSVQVFTGAVIAVNYGATNNVTPSGMQIINLPDASSVTPVTGDSVLLSAQTTASQNGLWIVNASGAWTRPTNFPSGDVIPQLCPIEVIDRESGTRWQLSTASGPITVDTTAQTWTAPGGVFGVANAQSIKLVANQSIVLGTAGGGVTVDAGNGNASGTGTSAGGNILLQSGNGSGSNTGAAQGGNLTLIAGNGGGTTNGKGGDISVTSGSASGTASAASTRGGNITVTAGAGGATANGAGGNIIFVPGAAGGTGTNGSVQLEDSAGIVQLATNTQGAKLSLATVGSLGTCAVGIEGTIRAVSDASSPTFGGILTGGSTTPALAFCNGTNWVAY